MDKKLLEKYLNNNCSIEELNIIMSWFRDSVHTAEGKAILYRIWDELPENKLDIKADFDTLLCKIHHEINLKKSRELIDKAGHDISRYNRRQYFIRILRNAAAILLLPVLGTGLFFSVKYYLARSVQVSVSKAYNEVFSSVDAITKVTLPDGSDVWLNHSSSLRYPAVFTGKFRNVELKGEGYFEVAHDTKVPFVVNAGEIQVLARGTTFNVIAYPDEKKIETTLIMGSVELFKSLSGGKTKPLYKMNPYDHAVYNKDNDNVITRVIDDDRYYSWMQGKLVFSADSLGEVVKKLGRWFNVEIQIADPELYDFTITATFIQETLPQVMDLLSMLLPVNYTITTRDSTVDGTFTKRKVILKYMKEV